MQIIEYGMSEIGSAPGITNGEALRGLSDKSLAEKMYMLTRYECPMELLDPRGDYSGCGERCEECISRWLKEECE